MLHIMYKTGNSKHYNMFEYKDEIDEEYLETIRYNIAMRNKNVSIIVVDGDKVVYAVPELSEEGKIIIQDSTWYAIKRGV